MTKSFRVSTLVAAILLVAFMAGSASALNTHLNITLSETVNTNVTFAENFFLVESRTYSHIQGVLTVVNPGTETVFDTNIRLTNIEDLSSDFVYSTGRNGYQVVYPNVTGNNSLFDAGSITNASFKSLGMDLDEDGVVDSVSVNSTHILFNITSEYQVLAYPLGTDISVPPQVLDQYWSITSLREDNNYNDGVVFATVRLNGTVATANELQLGSEVDLWVNDTNRSFAVVHIPELRSGNQTVFLYNISGNVNPPLDINTTYTDPEFATKVLAGERFDINLSASNIVDVGDLINVNITMQAESVNVTNNSVSQLFNFTLHNLSSSGDAGNVTESSNRTWYWEAGGGTIPIGYSFNISFQIRAPDTVSSSGTYLALTQTLEYEINTTASTLAVSEVRARSALEFNTTKQIVSPQDNESNNNVTWRSVPTVGATENINYTLERVTLWVTTTLDPNAQTGSLNRTYEPFSQINLTSNWQGASWYFNFTDGSSDANPPPIIWVKPYWVIQNTGNQIVNSSITVNGTDLYMNYIYVVNGYWLEVNKQVIDAGDGVYDIRTTVQNRGNGHTPQNLTVTVYDFIPEEFTPYNWTPTYNNASNVTGQFSGTAYRWDVGLRTNLSTSFAPRGDPLNNDFFYINYTVNGTGDFSVSELYIVGLDPRLVDGASSFEGVSLVQGIASTSREVIYLAIVLFLIAINVANFLMTHRISQKLDRK